MGTDNRFFTEFWNCEDAESDTVSVTIALKGGITKRFYSYQNTEEIVEINPAASDVFRHVQENRIQEQKIKGIQCTFGKNGIYFTITAKKEDIVECLKAVLEAVFECPVTETEFEEAKKQTIDTLRKNFKKEKVRSQYYMFEFTDMGKAYTYNGWARGLETITYEEFYTYTEALVNPENSIVIGNGMLEETEITSICDVLKGIQKAGTECTDYGYVPSENSVLDCHLVKNMSCGSIGALYFVFPDETVSPTEKMFLLLYINEMMFQEHGIVSADAFDASIIYSEEPVRRYEIKIYNIWSKKKIRSARERLLQRFENLIKIPKEFGIYAGEQLLSGVNVHQLIEHIQVCDEDMVYQTYKNANLKIANGAIINEGGRKDGRTTGIKAK